MPRQGIPHLAAAGDVRQSLGAKARAFFMRVGMLVSSSNVTAPACQPRLRNMYREIALWPQRERLSSVAQ